MVKFHLKASKFGIVGAPIMAVDQLLGMDQGWFTSVAKLLSCFSYIYICISELALLALHIAGVITYLYTNTDWDEPPSNQ